MLIVFATVLVAVPSPAISATLHSVQGALVTFPCGWQVAVVEVVVQ